MDGGASPGPLRVVVMTSDPDASRENTVKNFWTTVDRYPLIPVGTPDPYSPPVR
jgi:hypothetical protein